MVFYLDKFFFKYFYFCFDYLRFDNRAILLVSAIVLIFVFILTLVFGIIRIVNTAPTRVVPSSPASNTLINQDESVDLTAATSENNIKAHSDSYALAEDITKLIIELIFTLLAIFATFALHRYVKAKYAAVPTRE